MNGPFLFTVTDLARFLGKSSVTLRGWERKGLISLPRDSGGDRKLTSEDVRVVAQIAYQLKRISKERLQLVEATITLIQVIERKNDADDRTKRGSGVRQEYLSERSAISN